MRCRIGKSPNTIASEHNATRRKGNRLCVKSTQHRLHDPLEKSTSKDKPCRTSPLAQNSGFTRRHVLQRYFCAECQSYQNVSRETFWYDWDRRKPYKTHCSRITYRPRLARAWRSPRNGPLPRRRGTGLAPCRRIRVVRPPDRNHRRFRRRLAHTSSRP